MFVKLTARSEIEFAVFTVNQAALRHCIDVLSIEYLKINILTTLKANGLILRMTCSYFHLLNSISSSYHLFVYSCQSLFCLAFRLIVRLSWRDQRRCSLCELHRAVRCRYCEWTSRAHFLRSSRPVWNLSANPCWHRIMQY